MVMGRPTGQGSDAGDSPFRHGDGEVVKKDDTMVFQDGGSASVGSDDQWRVLLLEEVEGGEIRSMLQRKGTQSGDSPKGGKWRRLRPIPVRGRHSSEVQCSGTDTRLRWCSLGAAGEEIWRGEKSSTEEHSRWICTGAREEMGAQRGVHTEEEGGGIRRHEHASWLRRMGIGRRHARERRRQGRGSIRVGWSSTVGNAAWGDPWRKGSGPSPK
jgi:hypothetical protein